ncbi:MAG TPA: hypothetical protein VK574_13005 [Terracidiphilus sp.]|nr:hypothetical protein [Terracidiphilus sp.]
MKLKPIWVALLMLGAVIVIAIAVGSRNSDSADASKPSPVIHPGDNPSPDDPDDPDEPDHPHPQPAQKNVSWDNVSDRDVDDSGLNLTAYTVGVPEGWKFSGEMAPGQNCHGTGQTLVYTLSSPDDQIIIRRLHEENWSYGNGQQNQSRLTCGSVEMTSAVDFLVNIVAPQLHKSATVLEVLPATPEGEQAIEEERQHDQEKQTATAQLIGMPSAKALVNGARVHIAYEENGQQFEELLMAVVHCAETGAGRNCQTGGGTTVIRTPAGQLSALMANSDFLEMAADVHDNPDWQEKRTSIQMQNFMHRLQSLRGDAAQIERISWESYHQTMLNNDRAFQGMMANSRAFNAAQADQFQRSQAVIHEQEDAMGRSARKTEDFALDQRRYPNPYNGKMVTASNEFNRVWAAPDGTLAGTTGNVDPNDFTAPGSPVLTQLPPQD